MLCLKPDCTSLLHVSLFVEAAKDNTVPVHNLHSREVGQYALPGSIFDIPVRKDILHRVVRWQLAKRQQVFHFQGLSLVA